MSNADASLKAHLAEKIASHVSTIAQIEAQSQTVATTWLLDQERAQLAAAQKTLKAMGG